MIDFDKARHTNDYLISELVIARKENEVLTEHIQTLMKDLKDCSKLLDAFVAYVS